MQILRTLFRKAAVNDHAISTILSDSNPETIKDEATSVNDFGSLTNEKIDILAANIPANAMETIAEGYMDIIFEQIMDVKAKNRQDAVAFNKEIIEQWAPQIPESEQTKVYRHYFIHELFSYFNYKWTHGFNLIVYNSMPFYYRNYICYYWIQHAKVLALMLRKWWKS